MLMTQLFTAEVQLLFRPSNPCRKPLLLLLHSLLQLKLVLNADKTKPMLFSNSRKGPQMTPSVTTLEGNEIEVLHLCVYIFTLAS